MSEVLDIQQQRAIEAAQGYLALELPDAALRRLGLFQDAESTPAAVEQLRGEVYRQKEDYEKALRHFERVPTQDGKHLELRMSMAWCFKRIGRLDKAIEAMKLAYRESPKTAVVLYNLACYSAVLGDLTAARGIPAIVNIHNVELARRFSQRIIGLSQGRVIFDGPPDQLTDTLLNDIYGGQDWQQ